MEKAIPKTSIKVKFRRSSCLYPSFAYLIVSSHPFSWYAYDARSYRVLQRHRRWIDLLLPRRTIAVESLHTTVYHLLKSC